MKIYLVRHGEAVSPEIDPEKPLTPAGRRVVEKIAQQAGTRSFPLSKIFCSTKLRAKQTAAIIQEFIAPEAPLIELDYLNPNEPIERALTRIEAEEDNLMIVSHLPFLAKLCGQLVEGNENAQLVAFDPGTIVCLEEVNRNWAIDWILRAEEV